MANRHNHQVLPLKQIAIGNDTLVLKRGGAEVVVNGEGIQELVAFLIEQFRYPKQVEQVVDLFPGPDRSTVRSLCDHLAKRKLLVPDDVVCQSNEEDFRDVFYWNVGANPRIAREKLAARIAIVGINPLTSHLVDVLRATGFSNLECYDDVALRGKSESCTPSATVQNQLGQVSPATALDDLLGDTACVVATCDFGGVHLLRAWNRKCVERGTWFLPVYISDLTGVIGPFVVPVETACFECLRLRENSNCADGGLSRGVETALTAGFHSGYHPGSLGATAGLAASELTKAFLLEPLWRAGT